MPLCKIWIYKYYKNVTNMIDIVISDCYTVKSLKNIFCKMKKKQKKYLQNCAAEIVDFILYQAAINAVLELQFQLGRKKPFL